MNRRSLLLGGVVASVAGILGVKARPVEVEATPSGIPWSEVQEANPVIDLDDKLDLLRYQAMFPSDETRMALVMDHIRNSPEYQALLTKRVMEHLGIGVSGYQINQLMPYGTPPNPFILDPNSTVEVSLGGGPPAPPVPEYPYFGWYSHFRNDDTDS